MRPIYADDAIYELKRAFRADDFGKIIRCISRTPTADVVERSAYDQVRWERDTAIAQLEEIGKGFGETMDDVVVRKRGKWEIYVISMLDGEGCRCSECGFEGAPYWDFCPNCGADMRGEQDE